MLVDEGSNPFELGVAAELFGLRRPELDRPWYEFTLCAEDRTVRMHEGMFTMTEVAGLDAADAAGTVIVPNRPDPEAGCSPAVLRTIRRAAERGARLVSFCTGAFSLAEAGVLDGRPATTHWRWVEAFRERYPTVLLEPDVLYVDDGDVLTAAGSAATLYRRFQTELGTTPLSWLTTERVVLACRLLERGELSLDRVAHASGLGTAANLRTLVRRKTGLTPSDYRRRFGLVRAL